MAYPVSAIGVKEFLEFLVSKGELNQNTAGGLKTACEKVFSALDDSERANLKDLDVPQAVRRFVNKNPKALAPSSIGVYQARVTRALELLDRFNKDPGSFKPSSAAQNTQAARQPRPQNGSRKLDKKAPTPQRARASDSQQYSDSANAHVVHGASSAVNLSFPLRQDFVAQFIVPRDLTVKEAKRLGAYFMTLAIDFEPS